MKWEIERTYNHKKGLSSDCYFNKIARKQVNEAKLTLAPSYI